MVEESYKKFMVPVVIIVLAFLSFLVIKPLILSITIGLCMAYIFNSFFKKLNSKIKSKYVCATIVVALTVLVFVVPIILVLPAFTKQVFDIYLIVRDFDAYNLIKGIVPGLLSSPQVSAEILAASSTLKSALSDYLVSFFKNIIMDLPNMLFGLLIFIFTYFFALTESSNFKSFFSTIFPFSKEHEQRFYDRFEKVTNSVLFGHFIVGIVQGIVAGVGYFILGIPNALLLTVLTTIVGVIPVIGPWLVWIPADIYLFATGMTEPAMGLLIFGLFAINWIDAIMRPFVVSSRAEMNSAIALIGMIGGTIAFGAVGFILGPLILAYAILMVEIYKDKKQESIIFKKEEPVTK